MQQVITHIDQVDPRWLSGVLSAGPALTAGAVAAVDVEGGRSNWATNARLRLRYTLDARGTLPPQLFLKLVNTALDGESFGPSEVTYYTEDYVDVPDAPLVRCYHAAWSEPLQRYHLLLDDHGDSHVTALEKAPTPDYGLALMDGLAALHARWWGVHSGAMHDAAHISRFVAIAEPGVGHIIREFGDQLAAHWPDAIRSIYAQHPRRMIARTGVRNGFARIHGDVNATNILTPRADGRPIYILDRQPFDWSLTNWLGVYDVVYSMVLDWDVETRREQELPMLRRYYAGLLQRGVRDYTWDDLLADYRLMLPMGVYIATEFCRGGINVPFTERWLSMLRRTLTACDDHMIN